VFKVIVIYCIPPYPQTFYPTGATPIPPGTYLINREWAIVEKNLDQKGIKNKLKCNLFDSTALKVY
jgi:hypothetical protein